MTLKQLVVFIRSDLKSYGGVSAAKCLKIYLLSAHFRLILNYRIGKYFREGNKLFKAISLYYAYRQITKRGCQISYKANLGHGVIFKHPLGVVIGDNVVIGNNVSIWQQVTLGSHGRKGEAMEYPVVEDNVKIFAGAKVFGGISIGNGATIAANAVVNKSVAAGDVVGGIPAKSLKGAAK